MSQITPSTGADRPDHSSGQPDGTAPPLLDAPRKETTAVGTLERPPDRADRRTRCGRRPHRQPIGTDVVTGGGDTIRPFSSDIEFSIPTGPHGAVVFLTHGERDGRVWEAGVVSFA
jgi:hypothetical protein